MISQKGITIQEEEIWENNQVLGDNKYKTTNLLLKK